MKKFRYRLERVLHFRELVKDEKKRILGLARQELAAAKSRLADLEAEALTDRLQGKGILTIEELQLINAYANWLRAAISSQRERIVQCEEKVAAALAEYIEAAKEAESLVKHKDKKLTEYQEHIEKEQQKFLDELSTQRIGRVKLAESLERRAESQLEKESV